LSTRREAYMRIHAGRTSATPEKLSRCAFDPT
jgi:hypothetical protein